MRLVEFNSTDGYQTYPVLVNAHSVAFLRSMSTITNVIKTKIVFSGGAEINVIESMEEIQEKLKGNSGVVIPFRRD